MNWITVTQLNGAETSIDLAKVSRVERLETGTKFHFDALVPNAKNELVFKTIVVKENFFTITKAMKSKTVA